MKGEMTRQAIQDAVGLAHREHFRKTYLAPALDLGLIEMTLPDKPNSRSQRYRLTVSGRQWLEAHLDGSPTWVQRATRPLSLTPAASLFE